MPKLIEKYELRDIFNGDESGLFYKATPNKTMIYKNMSANSVKSEKERLILLFCANADGSEKLKPVCIGKSANPRYFKTVNKANLPVYYRHNVKAWMTEQIFREWLQRLDSEFRSQNRRILLLLDNFSGHKENKNNAPFKLTNIELHFYPPNCTSILQPMNQGIIQNFKTTYRRHLIQERLEAIENNSTIPVIDVYSAIIKINKAWKSVTKETIANCFSKGGIKKQSICSYAEFQDNTIESIKQFQASWQQLNNKEGTFNFNMDAYMNIDSDLNCHGVLSDEELIRTIQSTQEEDDDQDELNQETPEIVIITKNQAALHLKELRQFFMSQNNDTSSALTKIDDLEGLVFSNTNFVHNPSTSFL